jgi:hypothetical protein
MDETKEVLSYWVMSILSVLLGMLGIVLASGAADEAMQAFGLALAAFAVLFSYFAIDRTHPSSK